MSKKEITPISHISHDEVKEAVLKIWDHAGLDHEISARLALKKIEEDNKKDKKDTKHPDLKLAGMVSGRQLQHPQVGEYFGREGVLGAMSNNVKDISVNDVATKNNIAAKKINAGLVTRIIYSLIDEKTKYPLLFPIMWKPIINYFLGKLFGQRKIPEEVYYKAISKYSINEGSTLKIQINKTQLLEEFNIVSHDNRIKLGKYKLDNPDKLNKFARRGIKVTNPANNAAAFAPIAGAVLGGAIGNQIHGDDGIDPTTGVVYDPQAHNDDEYDGTGALIGLATGSAISGLAGNTPNSSKVAERMQRDGYVLSPAEINKLKVAANATKIMRNMKR